MESMSSADLLLRPNDRRNEGGNDSLAPRSMRLARECCKGIEVILLIRPSEMCSREGLLRRQCSQSARLARYTVSGPNVQMSYMALILRPASVLAGDDEQSQHAYEQVLDPRVVVHDDGHHPHVRQIPASVARHTQSAGCTSCSDGNVSGH